MQKYQKIDKYIELIFLPSNILFFVNVLVYALCEAPRQHTAGHNTTIKLPKINTKGKKGNRSKSGNNTNVRTIVLFHIENVVVL